MKKIKLRKSLARLEASAQKKTVPTHQLKKKKVKRPLISPYKLDDVILLIGEGDFSFARSLAKDRFMSAHNITATTLDSEEVMQEKYNCKDNIKDILDMGGIILYNVDGTSLNKTKELKGKRFSK